MDQITIGYLSWKRHDILEQTLQSHKENGLFDIIPPENRIILVIIIYLYNYSNNYSNNLTHSLITLSS